jgi:hypothetical protein|tara:strand:+ start:956 stop:2698 length:1743 start_codon:yes stop_codon:yes gene_type:complete
LFSKPPVVDFRAVATHCSHCGGELKVQKTRPRKVSTLHIGGIEAREVFTHCKQCGHANRSDELSSLVAPGANFGYDVLVYAAKALFLRHRNETEVVAELAQRNVKISSREVSLLGMKFITYLAIAHQRCAPRITEDMRTRGGYICHLDATCEGRDPLLMSSIDSLSEIVLGNVMLPAEDKNHIAPFLERIKTTYGIPLALVHDMGRGILKAVATVFPDVPDFIFHFLRDIGKDFLGAEYDTIRKLLSKHGVSAKLRSRAKHFKATRYPELIKALESSIENASLPAEALEFMPLLNVYALIQWTLKGKSEGHGYGFPFDHPHLVFAKRIRCLHSKAEKLQTLQLRGEWKDNKPYFKIYWDLDKIMKDKTLWKTVAAIEEKITVFENLRDAMRIAPNPGQYGLNDEGQNGNIRTIENRVKKFRAQLVQRKDYPHNLAIQKMIKQIDKYWTKLFADPITVQTASGSVQIQPQRTNNILEQFFRSLKRSNRRRTGNASSSRMLRTMLAETPLVRNLENPDYMKILLNGKASIEEVFAEIEINTLREAFRNAQDTPEKIPSKLKPLIAMADFPEKLLNMLKKAVA